ncbi:MAG: hypothetical protein J3R72DRAFT_213316 [Linnemannia gamsii]|nr:MAG: hypothetical protein J3R72DRAFT_213316 [Linnemannia gamsii]
MLSVTLATRAMLCRHPRENRLGSGSGSACLHSSKEIARPGILQPLLHLPKRLFELATAFILLLSTTWKSWLSLQVLLLLPKLFLLTRGPPWSPLTPHRRRRAQGILLLCFRTSSRRTPTLPLSLLGLLCPNLVPALIKPPNLPTVISYSPLARPRHRPRTPMSSKSPP